MTDFDATRARFVLPDGQIYLDGNSLGPLPFGAEAAMRRVLEDEWGRMAIGGWNRADWMGLPDTLGDRIGRLVGAGPGDTTVGDTLSIRLFQALAAAVAMTDRKVVLTDSGNFPSDIYMAQGFLKHFGRDRSLRIVAPEEVEAALTEEVGVLMLTQVDYRTGRRHDMAALTARAHEMGIVTVWDLAHSAGAFEVDLAGTGADFAVGCTYKYPQWRAGFAGLHLRGTPPRRPGRDRPERLAGARPPPSPSNRTTARRPAWPGCASARPPSCRCACSRPPSTSGTVCRCRICARVPSRCPSGSSPPCWTATRP